MNYGVELQKALRESGMSSREFLKQFAMPQGTYATLHNAENKFVVLKRTGIPNEKAKQILQAYNTSDFKKSLGVTTPIFEVVLKKCVGCNSELPHRPVNRVRCASCQQLHRNVYCKENTRAYYARNKKPAAIVKHKAPVIQNDVLAVLKECRDLLKMLVKNQSAPKPEKLPPLADRIKQADMLVKKMCETGKHLAN
jgi:hypothetical protein